MQSRLKRLKRMAALYGVVERMHCVELQQATSVVREAERAIEVQRMVGHTAELDGREALLIGDRMGWSFSGTQREVATWKRDRLEPIRVKWEELNEIARARYSASRTKSEQMNRLVEGVAARVETEAKRRAQATTDDRFLSRKLWMETREEARQE